jgi:hypothetical protein
MNASLDGKVTGSNVCESIDSDGEKRLTSFSTADGKITRKRDGHNRHGRTVGAVSGHQGWNVSEL